MLLLKAGEYEEALEECFELEELDRNLHGETSFQYAKNLKVIATISMILNRFSQASDYYNKAIEVFKKHKNTKKMVKELREKLADIEKTLKENPDIEERAQEVPHGQLPKEEEASHSFSSENKSV